MIRLSLLENLISIKMFDFIYLPSQRSLERVGVTFLVSRYFIMFTANIFLSLFSKNSIFSLICLWKIPNCKHHTNINKYSKVSKRSEYKRIHKLDNQNITKMYFLRTKNLDIQVLPRFYDCELRVVVVETCL